MNPNIYATMWLYHSSNFRLVSIIVGFGQRPRNSCEIPVKYWKYFIFMWEHCWSVSNAVRRLNPRWRNFFGSFFSFFFIPFAIHSHCDSLAPSVHLTVTLFSFSGHDCEIVCYLFGQLNPFHKGELKPFLLLVPIHFEMFRAAHSFFF